MALLLDGATRLKDIDMTSIPNSTQVLIHFWIRPKDFISGEVYIFDASIGSRAFIRTSGVTKRIEFSIEDSSGAQEVRIFPSFFFDDFEEWVSVDFIVDQGIGVAKCFINLVENRSETPLGLLPIAHIGLTASVCSKSDGTGFLPNGTTIDQFYYASTFDASRYLSAQGNLTKEFMADFYEFDSDTDHYLKKDSLSAIGAPELLFEGLWEKFNENRGSLANAILEGTLQQEEDTRNVIPV